MQVILQEIVASDLALMQTIAAIERDCFALPWPEKEIVSVCNRTDFCGVVAKRNGEIVGYLLGLTLFEDAEVLRVAVDEKFRGQKIGGAILDRFFELAKARGAQRMFLEVRVSNDSAIRLYESRAFTRGRVREKYYENGESAIEMFKRLV